MPQPQGWERQHDPQRRHGKTFVAVLAIDAALRRHPDKKVAFGVRTNGASAPLATAGHYSRASTSCARQLECCGRDFIGGVIRKKKSHRSRTLFYCALFIVLYAVHVAAFCRAIQVFLYRLAPAFSLTPTCIVAAPVTPALNALQMSVNNISPGVSQFTAGCICRLFGSSSTIMVCPSDMLLR